jgi:DNA repair protein RadD
MTTSLRPYQERALSECRRLVGEGYRAPLIVSPTGTGKTRIGASIAAGHLAKGGRVLWLAHRTELIEQARTIVPEGVTIASVQGLLARGERVEASLVVLDEARHYLASEFNTVINMETLRVGLDATPERPDGVGLGGLFDCVVEAIGIKEATDLGYLVPCEVIAPERPLGPKQLAMHPVEAYQRYGEGRKALVFCSTVSEAKRYAEDFKTEYVTGERPDREEIVEAYRRGALRVLVNCQILTEGFDDPESAVCILARGCGSPGLFLQMVGRVLRPFPGKSKALLIDLRGVSHIHGRPDDDRIYSLEGRGIKRKLDMPAGSFCPICGAVAPCLLCGYEPRGVRITNDPLVRFAGIRRDDEGVREVRLRRWIQEARSKGQNEGRAWHRYKGTYGEPPSRGLWARSRGT